MVDIEYIGKCLLLRGKEKKTLVVGDLHLGYEEMLNQTGVFVSRKLYNEMIGEFDKIFDGVGGRVDEVVLLGDIKHDFGNISRQEWNDVIALIDYLSGKTNRIIIVKGNHDKLIDFIIRKKGVESVDYFIDGEFCFLHGDRDFEEIYDKRIGYWVMGHAHPAIKLSEGVKIEKYKCFLEGKYKGKNVIIVPSFFEGNEGSDPRESNYGLAWDIGFNNFNVRVVGNGLEVLDFGKLKNIR